MVLAVGRLLAQNNCRNKMIMTIEDNSRFIVDVPPHRRYIVSNHDQFCDNTAQYYCIPRFVRVPIDAQLVGVSRWFLMIVTDVSIDVINAANAAPDDPALGFKWVALAGRTDKIPSGAIVTPLLAQISVYSSGFLVAYDWCGDGAPSWTPVARKPYHGLTSKDEASIGYFGP